MSGFQFSIGLDDTGAAQDTTMMGAQYAMTAGDTAITIKYAASQKGSATSTNNDGTDATSMGLVIGMGGATLTLAQNNTEVKSTAGAVTADLEASSAAIAYVVSDAISVQAYSGETDDNKSTTYKFKDTGYGVTYTVTGGLTASITHNSWNHTNTSGTGDSGSNTAIALNLSF